MLLNTGEYKESLGHVVKIISSARSNAAQKASAEMILMYWFVGNELVARSEWGNKYIETLSRDIRAAFPGIKGFSARSLKYMAKFAREVDSELCNSYCTIPWGHVVKLLDKTNPGQRRDWYRGEEDIHYTSGMSLVEAKRRLVAAGLEEAPVDMSETEARVDPQERLRAHRTAPGGASRGAASCRPLRELRRADGEACGRRKLWLHLFEAEEVGGAGSIGRRCTQYGWEFGGAIMSLGYAGRAVLIDSDGRSAHYAYECENWNCKDDAPKLDGEIYIEFEPIATARKIVRTKRYPQCVPLSGMAENVDFYELMEAGSLSVRNCSNTTRCDTNGVDLQAFSLISKIAYHIQEDGAFPEKVCYVK